MYSKTVWSAFTQTERTGFRECSRINICRDEPAALDAIDSVCQRGPGAPEENKNAVKTTVDNVHDCFKEKARPTGNTKSAALRRLRKDRPDLHKQVIDKNMSAHKAMVEAGFRKKTISISITDPESAAKAILKHADDGCNQYNEVNVDNIHVDSNVSNAPTGRWQQGL